MRKVILLNKPYNVLSQFTDLNNDGSERGTLADYINTPDVHPAGRLDRDSEGLLILTDSGALQNKLTSPTHEVSKTYWAQVEGLPVEADLRQLCEGIELKDGPTLPVKASIMQPPNVWPRNPPIRQRKNIPTTWLALTLREGRNRQVRRMCAAIGHPVLRLIRYRVASWTLDGLSPGESARGKFALEDIDLLTPDLGIDNNFVVAQHFHGFPFTGFYGFKVNVQLKLSSRLFLGGKRAYITLSRAEIPLRIHAEVSGPGTKKSVLILSIRFTHVSILASDALSAA